MTYFDRSYQMYLRLNIEMLNSSQLLVLHHRRKRNDDKWAELRIYVACLIDGDRLQFIWQQLTTAHYAIESLQ
jgi:hypothetical protein